MKQRSSLFAMGLLVTLALAIWVARLGNEDEGNDLLHTLPAQTTNRGKNGPPPPPIDLALLDKHRSRVEAWTAMNFDSDLFPQRNFEPPPPPPSKPVAPPLPFRYTGFLDDAGSGIVFLAEGSQMRAVRSGDLIDSRYRVTAVNRAQIDLIYLPLNQPQSLMTGILP